MSYVKMGCGAVAVVLGMAGWHAVANSADRHSASGIPRPTLAETEKASEATVEAMKSKMNQLQDELSRVNRDSQRTNQALLEQVQRLEDRLETDDASAQDEPSSDVLQTAEHNDEDDLLRMQKIDEEAMLRVERLDEALYSEPRDEAWASPAETRLSEAFQDLKLADSRMLQTTCGATFCRMEVMHASEEGSHQIESIVDHVGRMNYYLQTFHQQDGQHQTLAYFIREGADDPEHAIRRLWREP